ncbi:MAG: hypothetical protein KCHDKBKB_00747 [Elusimicrobia bacterium]|nr:hypothetical protein [Elusimicrobiota bacterium]
MIAELAIARAKIKMLRLLPFFADLTIMMGARVSPEVATAATDGEYLYYNPKFIEKLSKEEVIGVLLHEVLHAALGHVWRKKNRDMFKWNIATDYAVNAIIRNEKGTALPKGHLYEAKFANMSAEEIYDKIKVVQTPCPFCGGGSGKSGGGEKDNDGQGGGKGDKKGKKNRGGDGNGGKQKNGDGEGNYCPHCSHEMWGKPSKTMDKDKMKKLQKKWEGAMKEVVKNRGDVPEGMSRYVQALEAKEDWRQILAAYLSSSKSDFDFTIRDRRMMSSPFYLPDMRDEEDLRDVVVVFDTSGSVSDHDLNIYFSETKKIMESFPGVQGWVSDCDCTVYNFLPIEEIDKLAKQFRGYGGTSHIPVFREIDNRKVAPSVVICFTDLYTEFPKTAPEYPVLWVVNPGGAAQDAPFGRTIRLQKDNNGDTI